MASCPVPEAVIGSTLFLTHANRKDYKDNLTQNVLELPIEERQDWVVQPFEMHGIESQVPIQTLQSPLHPGD